MLCLTYFGRWLVEWEEWLGCYGLPHYLTKMRYTFNLIILEILNLRIITQVIIFEPFLFYFFEYVQKLVSVTFRCWCVGLGVPISTHHHPKASVVYLLNICNDLGVLTFFFIKNINLYIYIYFKKVVFKLKVHFLQRPILNMGRILFYSGWFIPN